MKFCLVIIKKKEERDGGGGLEVGWYESAAAPSNLCVAVKLSNNLSDNYSLG